MDLYQYLKSSKLSLFRFESLQEYKVEGELFDDESMKDWWSFIESKTKSGVSMHRVRLLIEPLTEYVTKELDVHKKSKVVGDNIKIIKGSTFNTLNIQQKDFWLIDARIVLQMEYSLNGEYLGFNIIDRNIDYYINIVDILLENSFDL